MNKWVIYTSIVGNYDKLPNYKFLDPHFDYICFSNDYKDESYIGHWRIKNITEKIKDPVRLSRYPKINPHIFLKEYEYSVWIDGNILINSEEVYKDIFKIINGDVLWSGIHHVNRNCSYEEIKMCIYLGKGKLIDHIKSGVFLKKCRFPKKIGLYENNFIIRKHNNPKIIKIDTEWWKLYMKYSSRDQIMLPYVFHMNKFLPNLMLPSNICIARDSRFIYLSHYKDNIISNHIYFFYRKLLLYAIAGLKLF